MKFIKTFGRFFDELLEQHKRVAGQEMIRSFNQHLKLRSIKSYDAHQPVHLQQQRNDQIPIQGLQNELNSVPQYNSTCDR